VPTFYRIVRNNPPTLDDFLSDKDAGKPEPSDPEKRRLWEGRSVYNTEIQARKKARNVPILGNFIAAVEVIEPGPISYERTTMSSGHHTLWGDARILLEQVHRVVSV
jgi:hypothetical protein